ncbi:MAG: alpha/beta hydrolase [Gemmataceae bacterium]
MSHPLRFPFRSWAIALVMTAPGPLLSAADNYKLGREAQARADVPKGQLSKHQHTSLIFEGTTRDYWMYVPAGAKADGPPVNVLVFQDGQWYQDPKGQWRVPVVLDNLIAQGAIPPTAALFISPGTFPEKGQPGRANRSVEYDTLSPKYATFLEKEMLPLLAAQVKLTTEASGRAICGISSGGICAFTVAYERPDLFRNVISHVGSFTNIRGGDVYPGKIRKVKKPIRVYLQDGFGDLDNAHGSWPLQNLAMAAALRFNDYDYKFVYGDGGHNGKHGAADLPNALRWIWRDAKSAK